MTTTALDILPLSLLGASSTTINLWEPIKLGTPGKSSQSAAKATWEGRYHKVNALQWLLTHSLAAKLLAIKRVTSMEIVTGAVKQHARFLGGLRVGIFWAYPT